MTREEAITVLKAFMENPLFSEVHKAAFNIAIHDIKAYHDWNINNLILVNKDNYEPIEQEPTTKNDLGVDCISRADAIHAVSEALKHTFVEYEDIANKVIGKLPSVTPQEPILDKIRTEIVELWQNEPCAIESGCLDEILEIIDKYKGESEGQMAEYHVGCGIAGIYAGTLNKRGDRWVNKSDVTQEVLNCAFEYLYVNKKEFRATIDGKRYAMRIVPITESQESEDNK